LCNTSAWDNHRAATEGTVSRGLAHKAGFR